VVIPLPRQFSEFEQGSVKSFVTGTLQPQGLINCVIYNSVEKELVGSDSEEDFDAAATMSTALGRLSSAMMLMVSDESEVGTPAASDKSQATVTTTADHSSILATVDEEEDGSGPTDLSDPSTQHIPTSPSPSPQPPAETAVAAAGVVIAATIAPSPPEAQAVLLESSSSEAIAEASSSEAVSENAAGKSSTGLQQRSSELELPTPGDVADTDGGAVGEANAGNKADNGANEDDGQSKHMNGKDLYLSSEVNSKSSKTIVSVTTTEGSTAVQPDSKQAVADIPSPSTPSSIAESIATSITKATATSAEPGAFTSAFNSGAHKNSAAPAFDVR
jgi:hypothetical protein